MNWNYKYIFCVQNYFIILLSQLIFIVLCAALFSEVISSPLGGGMNDITIETSNKLPILILFCYYVFKKTVMLSRIVTHRAA